MVGFVYLKPFDCYWLLGDWLGLSLFKIQIPVVRQGVPRARESVPNYTTIEQEFPLGCPTPNIVLLSTVKKPQKQSKKQQQNHN